MGRTESLEAIVLRTHDVGEADRFCILLSREKGKIAVRARGVRKPKSTMGGGLLPLRRCMLTVHCGESGYLVTSATADPVPAIHRTVEGFLELQLATDLLLHLLQDEEPLRDVYAMTAELCSAERIPCDAHLLFSLRLLETLGMLPHYGEGIFGEALHEEERQFIRTALSAQWMAGADLSAAGRKRLRKLCEDVMSHQVTVPLRSVAVAHNTLLAREMLTAPNG